MRGMNSAEPSSKSTHVGADASVRPAEQRSAVFRRPALAHPDAGVRVYVFYLREFWRAVRPPTGPAGRRRYYFLSAPAGTLTEAESFVISSNRFCASAISAGWVATRR